MEAAEEADLNHEYNASLVVSPLGSGCQAGWLCPTPTAAGAAAIQGAEQQLLHLCPCTMLSPGFVSEVFAPAPEAHGDGIGTGRRKLRADEDAMDTSPLCPGDSKMGRPLREARANILDAGCHGCFPLLW